MKIREMLIGAVLVLTLLGGFALGGNSLVQARQRTAIRARALMLANDRLQEIRNLPYREAAFGQKGEAGYNK